jgi:hypothetical protein
MALKVKGFAKCNNQSCNVTKAKVLNPHKSLATNKDGNSASLGKQSLKRLQ